MRRATVLLATFALAALSVGVLAGPAGAEPEPMVDVCHVNGVSDVFQYTPHRSFSFGKVITVAAASVPGHVGHGDSATLGAETEAVGEYSTDVYGGLTFLRSLAGAAGLTVWAEADCFIIHDPSSGG